jgi:hypothetical protein
LSPALQRAKARRAELRAAGVSLAPVDPLTKARANPTSLRLAINAKCYDCGGQDADPGWHDRIRHCAVPGCSLYPVRPFQRGDTDEQDGA